MSPEKGRISDISSQVSRQIVAVVFSEGGGQQPDTQVYSIISPVDTRVPIPNTMIHQNTVP